MLELYSPLHSFSSGPSHIVQLFYMTIWWLPIKYLSSSGLEWKHIINRSMDSLYTIQQGGDRRSIWESYGTEGDVLLLLLLMILL